MDDLEYYTITNRTYTTPIKKTKSKVSYKNWEKTQGREDAEMLIEKKSDWSSKKENSWDE